MSSTAPSTPAAQVQIAINAAIAALDAQDAWHADYDDHGGYPESELQQQTAGARAGLLVALTLVWRLAPPSGERCEQPAVVMGAPHSPLESDYQ